MNVSLFKEADYQYEPLEGTIGVGYAEITRFVRDEISSTLGGGIVKMKTCKFPWTVRYDEVIYVIEGEVIIHFDGKKLVGQKGDSFFIEKGSPIVYESLSESSFFFSLYPANWRKKEV
ncbi:ethanolamine utilization protein EutQ (cupin superfamily) [Caldalkalibacillus uzonensis]|uniref:Ethanolamine utilization protein EutQ (Cupin superfamily) n=1 Tax=Caldalkalibacillus uzonensis TaxID=353224 RepID=A0ABU0CVT9_9BACI|nr:cupin domain-containing protein [Caldalkalibacillus uzonensis]MDQ0339964.1 ethanolamine utilization protein EutQ (cupin superfamily) [Caldalkalibacillus uzonensis]